MTIEKINGKLTKREIIRRIASRAAFGATPSVYNVKYVARRIGRDPEATKQIVKYVVRNLTGFSVNTTKHNFEFSF
jgi:hypothetical protein